MNADPIDGLADDIDARPLPGDEPDVAPAREWRIFGIDDPGQPPTLVLYPDSRPGVAIEIDDDLADALTHTLIGAYPANDEDEDESGTGGVKARLKQFIDGRIVASSGSVQADRLLSKLGPTWIAVAVGVILLTLLLITIL